MADTEDVVARIKARMIEDGRLPVEGADDGQLAAEAHAVASEWEEYALWLVEDSYARERERKDREQRRAIRAARRERKAARDAIRLALAGAHETGGGT